MGLFRRASTGSAKAPALPAQDGMTAGLAEAPAASALNPPACTRVVPVEEGFLRQQRIVAGIDSLEASDLFHILRTSVAQRLAVSGGNTLGIISPCMADGKTVVSANLAVSLSRVPQHTVLLVDLDLRRPNLHKVFGLEAGPSLADYLLADTPLSACLVNPGIERLVSAPMRRVPTHLLGDPLAGEDGRARPGVEEPLPGPARAL